MKKTFIIIALALATTAFADNTNVTNNTNAASNANVTGGNARHYTYQVYGNIPVAKTAFEEEHVLGKEISEKWNTFIHNYTRIYDVEVGLSSSGTEIRKPAVFKAVERADKYIRRMVKNGQMERGQAIKTLSHVLDCANVICFEDNTDDFESEAHKAKDGKEVIELFGNVELQQM